MSTLGVYQGGVRSIECIRQRCYVDPDTDCWHWRGAMSTHGDRRPTPSIRITALGRALSMGAVIAYLKTGKTPKRGHVWRVVCKTPNCANPDHRKPTTRAALHRALQTGKSRSPLTRIRISLGRRKKLSPEAVNDIRSSDETLRVLGERWGVTAKMVSRVRRGERCQVVSPFAGLIP